MWPGDLEFIAFGVVAVGGFDGGPDVVDAHFHLLGDEVFTGLGDIVDGEDDFVFVAGSGAGFAGLVEADLESAGVEFDPFVEGVRSVGDDFEAHDLAIESGHGLHVFAEEDDVPEVEFWAHVVLRKQWAQDKDNLGRLKRWI